MIHGTHSAGGVVRNTEGEIALVLHDGDFWGFPKGHIDAGEDALTAAKREIQEEIGISQLELKKEFEPYTRIKAGDEDKSEKEMKTIHMFLFDTSESEFHLTDPRHGEARWIPIKEVTTWLTHPKDKDFFEGVKGLLK